MVQNEKPEQGHLKNTGTTNPEWHSRKHNMDFCYPPVLVNPLDLQQLCFLLPLNSTNHPSIEIPFPH